MDFLITTLVIFYFMYSPYVWEDGISSFQLDSLYAHVWREYRVRERGLGKPKALS